MQIDNIGTNSILAQQQAQNLSAKFLTRTRHRSFVFTAEIRVSSVLPQADREESAGSTALLLATVLNVRAQLRLL